MSKICICILTDSTLDKKQIGDLVAEQLTSYGLTAFFKISYIEPFLEEMVDKSSVLFSVADTDKYDNCELFLLPDNCSINGKRNNTPFCERIKVLKSLLSELLKSTSRIDIFAGDSGLRLCEFRSFHISLEEFENVFNRLNCVCPIDVHITITGTEDDSLVSSETDPIDPK